jgi:hypothetical protein
MDEMLERLQKDYKVHEALNLLKGMHILSANSKKPMDSAPVSKSEKK